MTGASSCRTISNVNTDIQYRGLVTAIWTRRPRLRFASQRDDENRYHGYRFPPEIIQQAIWLYLRFTLSLRDVEDLLAERGITISYETVRRWVTHFGPTIAADLRKRRPKPSTTWHLDEVYLKIDVQSTPKERSSMYWFRRKGTRGRH